MDAQTRKIVKRVNSARAFPTNTCPASRHAEITERDELRLALARLLTWVDGLPVKHPQQFDDRERAMKLVQTSSTSS